MLNRPIVKSKNRAILAEIAIVCDSLDTCASTLTSQGPLNRWILPLKPLSKLLPSVHPQLRRRAHWIPFKEEQRLDWQEKYLTQLCEADQEIGETYELIADFTTLLRERQGERLDGWLQKVETQGIVELKNFAQASKKGLWCGESWPHPGVEQRPDRRPGESIETLKEANVWPRPL
jgi:hypothetical protein